MFYKQYWSLLDNNEINSIGNERLEEFDKWLASLTTNNRNNITASRVAQNMNISYALSKLLLRYAEKVGLLDLVYIVRCPKCDFVLGVVLPNELLTFISEGKCHCMSCDENMQISADNIYCAYNLKETPFIQETSNEEVTSSNFNSADSLKNNIHEIYRICYHPSESAYEELKILRTNLDQPFPNTTEKGHAMDKLVQAIINNIEGVNCSTQLKASGTSNQFDCTGICLFDLVKPSIYRWLCPNFIIECKNEKKAPKNDYFGKLMEIIINRESHLGIVWSRKSAPITYFKKARENYLKHNKIILSLSDNDLKRIIDERVNFLEYLEYQISKITLDTPDVDFHLFKQ